MVLYNSKLLRRNISVADPHPWFQSESGFGILGKCSSGSGVLMSEKLIKCTATNLFSWSKNAIYLSLGLHKERPSYRRSIQPSTENIQHFKRTLFNTPLSVRPSDSSVSEDARTGPRTVATLTLALRSLITQLNHIQHPCGWAIGKFSDSTQPLKFRIRPYREKTCKNVLNVLIHTQY
jgi:hypothetical protein